MLRIRLSRTGKKNQKSFRIVVGEHSKAVKGSYMDVLGYYLPTQKNKPLSYDKDKILDWIKKGAQPTESVANLLKKDGVPGMDKFIFFKPDKKAKKKNAPDEEPAAPAAPAPAETAEAPAEEPKKEEPAQEEPPKEEAPKEEAAPAPEEKTD